MAAKGEVRSLSSKYNPYFFLSYAHTPMIAEYPEADPDRWVKTFFRDLVITVRRYASHSRTV